MVSVVGPSTVRGVEGGAATLACEARYEPPPRRLPLAALDVRWRRGDELINLQVTYGTALT